MASEIRIADIAMDTSIQCRAAIDTATVAILRKQHQIDEPHHADTCKYCRAADAAITKAEGR